MTDPLSARIAVPAQLETVGPAIMAIANMIDSELSQLKSLLAPLHEFWTGQANIGWQDLQAIWDAAAAELMSSAGTLGAISQASTTNWHNYVDAETANIRTWAS